MNEGWEWSYQFKDYWDHFCVLSGRKNFDNIPLNTSKISDKNMMASDKSVIWTSKIFQ